MHGDSPHRNSENRNSQKYSYKNMGVILTLDIYEHKTTKRNLLTTLKRKSPYSVNVTKTSLLCKYSRTSNNGHCRGIQILSVIGGVR
jgi:hypothetical protein